VVAVNEVVLGQVDSAEERFARLVAVETHGRRRNDPGDARSIGLAGLAEVATARGDVEGALAAWRVAERAVDQAAVPWRLIVAAAALASTVRLAGAGGATTAEERRAYRRLRGRVLALARFPQDQMDVPVFASGALGLGAFLLARTDGAGAAIGAELVELAVRLGARLDFPSLEAVTGVAAALAASRTGIDDVADPDQGVQRVVALLSTPSARIPSDA
jgi:hypothetical protein